MKESHPAVHDELLIAVLSGEHDPATEEFRRLLATCPTCRERWERVRATAARVSQVGQEERRALEQALDGPPAPGEERIQSVLTHLARAERHASPRAPRWIPWLAAAGLLAALGAWWYASPGRGGDEQEPDIPLGDVTEGLRLVGPVGKVDAFDLFRWAYDGADATFLLTIFAESEAGERGPRLHEIPCGGDTEWKPDIELPARIQWEVVLLDGFGVPIPGSPSSASAWR